MDSKNFSPIMNFLDRVMLPSFSMTGKFDTLFTY